MDEQRERPVQPDLTPAELFRRYVSDGCKAQDAHVHAPYHEINPDGSAGPLMVWSEVAGWHPASP